jgi:FixJ family two-component response regulator
MEAPRVFVIDDDASVRGSLIRLLRSAGYETEAFDSAQAFLGRAPVAGVACLILDLSMPGVTGSELQERLARTAPELPIIFLSGHAGVPDSVQAMKRGAVDFLTKPVDEEVLLAAIETALERHRQCLAQNAEIKSIRQRIATLTPRELETAQWVIAGLLNKRIAAELDIAETTVKIHRSRIKEKLGVDSVAELVRLFAVAGIEPKVPSG